jgi:hypothetical protein
MLLSSIDKVASSSKSAFYWRIYYGDYGGFGHTGEVIAEQLKNFLYYYGVLARDYPSGGNKKFG